MSATQSPKIHTNTRRRLLGKAAVISAWSTPALQIVTLPTHAQTSELICGQQHVPGRWAIELFGIAASNRELLLNDDGSADGFVSGWRFADGELTLAKGFSWLLNGRFNGCDELRGSYVNTIVIPPLGNIVVRRGDWLGKRIA